MNGYIKKISLFACLVITGVTMQAQIVIGGAVSYWSSKQDNRTSHSISFDIAHPLSSKWAIGANGGFKYNKVAGKKTQALTFNPYVRYIYFSQGVVRLFVDGTAGIAPEYTSSVGNSWSWEAGLKPGISVKMTEHIWLAAGLGFVGYRDSRSSVSALGNRGWGIDIDGSAFTFGFYYTF